MGKTILYTLKGAAIGAIGAVCLFVVGFCIELFNMGGGCYLYVLLVGQLLVWYMGFIKQKRKSMLRSLGEMLKIQKQRENREFNGQAK